MKKRLLSMLLTLAMVMSFVPGMTLTASAASFASSVNVFGQTLDDASKYLNESGQIVETEPENGYAHYNPENGTLTIKNFEKTGSGMWQRPIQVYGDIKINVIGTNSLRNDDEYVIYNEAGSITITGVVENEVAPSLAIKSNTQGIFTTPSSGGTVAISGVALTIDTAANGITAKQISITNNSEINITAGNYGISAQNASNPAISIEDSSVTVNSNWQALSAMRGAYDKYNISISGSSNVTLTSKDRSALECNEFNCDGLTMLASENSNGIPLVEYNSGDMAGYKHIKIGSFIKSLEDWIRFSEEEPSKVIISKPVGVFDSLYYKYINASDIADFNSLINTEVKAYDWSNWSGASGGEVFDLEYEEGGTLNLVIATADGNNKITGIFAGTYTLSPDVPIVSSPAPGVLKIRFANDDTDGVTGDDLMVRVYRIAEDTNAIEYITGWTDIYSLDSSASPDHTMYLEPLDGGTYGVEACPLSELEWVSSDGENTWNEVKEDLDSSVIVAAVWDANAATDDIEEEQNPEDAWKVAEITNVVAGNTIDLADAILNTYITGYYGDNEPHEEEMQAIFLASDATASGAGMYQAAKGDAPALTAFEVAYISYGGDLDDPTHYGGYNWYKVSPDAVIIQGTGVKAPVWADIIELNTDEIVEQFGIPDVSVVSYNYTCDPAIVLDNVVTMGTLQLIGSSNEGCIDVKVEGDNFISSIMGLYGKTVISGVEGEGNTLTVAEATALGELLVEDLDQFDCLMAVAPSPTFSFEEILALGGMTEKTMDALEDVLDEEPTAETLPLLNAMMFGDITIQDVGTANVGVIEIPEEPEVELTSEGEGEGETESEPEPEPVYMPMGGIMTFGRVKFDTVTTSRLGMVMAGSGSDYSISTGEDESDPEEELMNALNALMAKIGFVDFTACDNVTVYDGILAMGAVTANACTDFACAAIEAMNNVTISDCSNVTCGSIMAMGDVTITDAVELICGEITSMGGDVNIENIETVNSDMIMAGELTYADEEAEPLNVTITSCTTVNCGNIAAMNDVTVTDCTSFTCSGNISAWNNVAITNCTNVTCGVETVDGEKVYSGYISARYVTIDGCTNVTCGRIMVGGGDVTINNCAKLDGIGCIMAEDGNVTFENVQGTVVSDYEGYPAVMAEPGTIKVIGSLKVLSGEDAESAVELTLTENVVNPADVGEYFEITLPSAPETPSNPPVYDSGDYTPPTVDVPVSNDENKVDVKAEVSGKDATIKPLNDKQIEELVGDENASGDVVIDLTDLGKTIDTAGIPKKTLEAIVEAAEDAGNNTEHLVIKLSTAELKLDDAAMRAIVDQANGNIIKFNFDDVGTTRLNSKQKAAVKDMDVRKGYEAYITVNGARISDFKGGNVEIIVPYDVPAGEAVAAFSVWYIDEQGNLEKQKSTYDGKNKWFVVTHFSDYVIAYNEDDANIADCPKDETCPIHPFTDTDKQAWYHDGVHFCIATGMMNGVAADQFAPNMTTSRAMVVTMLWRMEGSPLVEVAEGFNDVYDNDWYNNAIRWATNAGIVEGYEGYFNPNDSITREQMATILWRYAKYKGYDVSVGEETNILSYEDAFDVSDWAMEAMQWACGSGLIEGIEKNNTMYLDPKGNADRSQSATMIYRFCEELKK